MRIIAINYEEKLKNYAKEVELDVFLDKASSGRIGGKTVSDILSYIVNNTKGQPNTSILKNNLKKGIHYFLYDVEVSKLKIQDSDIVKEENKSFKGSGTINPIVIDKDYDVIDGRHRSVAHKGGTIPAYVPAELYYNLVRK